MNVTPFPGYEDHLYSNLAEVTDEVKKYKEAQGKAMMSFELPDGMTMEDRFIPRPDADEELQIRVFTPANLPDKAPMILDIHGGGFVAGTVAFDNARCIAIAERVPAIVVAVEYRLTGKTGYTYKETIADCHTAYMYLHEHADEFGGNGERIGLHGSSAGGTIAEGLALYLRDRNELTPALTVLNCPTMDTALETTPAFQQLYQFRMGPANKFFSAEAAYLGGYDGTVPSYYAFPKFCHDLGGLGAQMIIMGEYDTLRDTALEYGQRLLQAGVPTEMFLAPRVGHTFTAAPHPYTDFVHDMMAWSFKREFGMLDELKK